jgi:hypothetical protein
VRHKNLTLVNVGLKSACFSVDELCNICNIQNDEKSDVLIAHLMQYALISRIDPKAFFSFFDDKGIFPFKVSLDKEFLQSYSADIFFGLRDCIEFQFDKATAEMILDSFISNIPGWAIERLEIALQNKFSFHYKATKSDESVTQSSD